jgi:tetratricopeptide (TPR) repeat protein
MSAAGRLLAFLGIGFCLASLARADAHDDFVAGNAAVGQKQWADAAQDYMRVTAQLPKYAPAWKALSSCRYYMGDFEGAVASADRYVALQPADAAFAHWSDSLRAKLNLPPSATPAPAATPVPTVAPAAADSGILVAAPPPDAEAEAVPLEAAQQLNAEAAQGAVATEQKAQQDAADDMAADAARVKAAQKGPTSRARAQVGLRLLGGWALGLGSFSYGESVDDPVNLSPQAYDASPAQGGSGAVEALLDAGPHVELSLGVYPVAWTDTRDSSATSTVTRSNSAQANGLLMPVMLSVAWRQALTQGWSLVAAGGAGLAPGNRVSVKTQTVQTYATGLTVTTANADYDYAAALAWRAAAGAEWQAGTAVSLYLGLQLLGADFASVAPSGNVQSTDETGASVPVPAAVALPGPEALSVLSLQFMAGLTLRY